MLKALSELYLKTIVKNAKDQVKSPSSKVDAYIQREKRWQDESTLLREIAQSTGLDEDFKWGHPCYCLGSKNVVLMHGFKEYCALLFFKGALMSDPDRVLVQQTENVQSARQMRFTSLHHIKKQKKAIKSLIEQAIAVEKSGQKVALKKSSEFVMVDEFRELLASDSRVADAFHALTPGRQRAYLLHFSSAKQEKTRRSRIERCTGAILAGKGLDD